MNECNCDKHFEEDMDEVSATDFMNKFMKKIKSTTFEDLIKSDWNFIRDIVDKISTI